MEELLELAKKSAQQAEVYQASSISTPVKFEANQLKQIQTKENISTALRIVKDGRLGFARASGHYDPRALVEMALETAAFGSPVQFELPGKAVLPAVDTYDDAINKVSIEQMAALGGDMIAMIKAHTPDVQCSASVSKGISGMRIINSRGCEVEYNRSFFSAGLEGVVVKDDDMLFVGDGHSSCRPLLQTDDITGTVIRQLDLAGRNAAVRSQTMPVIFTPDGVASALIAPLLSAFNGKTVFMGASPLAEKLGEPFFDYRLSIWDDAAVPYQVASCPCDDEGVPAGRTALVNKGEVSHFIYDLATAALARTASTGNGGRNGGLPTPSMHSVVIEGGDTSFNDLVKGLASGLIIEELMGASQGNTLNGDFSGNVLLGYKVENGEIIGRVKNTMVSGNVYRLLRQIEALSKETKWVGGTINTPSIYCLNVSVAAKEG